MPPAESRGLRIHKPCKCSRGRGASQSTRSDDGEDDDGDDDGDGDVDGDIRENRECSFWCKMRSLSQRHFYFENESLIFVKTRNQ